MALIDAIREAQACASPPPANELETCDRVIYPLLRAAGYEAIEIAAQRHSHGIPDYTILPAQPDRTWYVEAEAWSVLLEEYHASQALTYAYLNGKRWAILTNGREWRLYDARVAASGSRERQVLCARLGDDSAMEEFLLRVGRASVCSGQLEGFADRVQADRHAAQAAAQRRSFLRTVLPRLLTDSGSELVSRMCDVLRAVDGLSSLTAEEIAEHFRSSRPAALRPGASATLSRGRSSALAAQEGLPADERGFWQGFLDEGAARGVDTSTWTLPRSENHIVHR